MSDTTIGAYGGAVTFLHEESRERVHPAVQSALRAPRELPSLQDPAAATVLPLTLRGDELCVPADLRGTTALDHASLPRPLALRTLTRVARTLQALHARGVAHGDLRPAMILLDAQGSPALLVPAHASPPGALLRARLGGVGEDPACVGFVAPEVLSAVECTAASDVYALAAMVYASLTGLTPVGQLNLRPFAPTPEGDLAQAVEAALNQSPASRPPLAALAEAITLAAEALARGAEGPGPYRGAFDAASAEASRRVPPELSPGLLLVLIVGGLCAFLGAILLVSAGWDVVGQAGRVAMLAALTAASLGAGQLAAARGLSTGAAVARALAGLFGVVAVGYSFYLLNEAGRLGLLVGLCALSLAGGALAARRGAPWAGLSLLALGSQLGWAVGAQAVHMALLPRGAAVVTGIAAAVSATSYALAVGQRSALLGSLGALDVAVFLAALGVWLERGTAMGLAQFTLAGAALYLLLARIATRPQHRAAASPFAVAAALTASVSVLAGLHVMHDRWLTHGVIGALWPYLVAAVALAASPLASPAGSSARFVALVTLAVAPTAEALLRDELGFTVVALAVGLASLLAVALAPSLRARGEARTELLLAALLGVLTAPSLRVSHVIESIGREGDLNAGGAWLTLVASSAALLTVAYALTDRLQRAQRRTLEVAALGQLFSMLTARTLADDGATLPAVVALLASSAGVALGLTTRRAAVLVVGATSLLVNGWAQYFIRLADVLPLSVRLVGFGVGLLLGGVVYEQTLRPRLAALKDWG